MKFIGLIISLAIIGYAISIYLDKPGLTTASPDGAQSKPKDYIDQARQSTDAINQSLQQGKERLDGSN